MAGRGQNGLQSPAFSSFFTVASTVMVLNRRGRSLVVAVSGGLSISGPLISISFA